MLRKVKQGDFVRLHYVMRLEDGSIFYATFSEGPVIIKTGEDKIIKGLDNALIGMSENEFKSIKINASNIFGAYDPRKVFVISKNELPKNIDVQIGMTLQRTEGDGNKLLFRVVNMYGDMVMLDANHPLAGRNIEIEVLILSISDDINELNDEHRYKWVDDRISSFTNFDEIFNNYIFQDNKKILICVSTFNRKRITQLCLEQIKRYKTDNCYLQVFNDHSTEYDNSFLKEYADKVLNHVFPFFEVVV